MTQSSDPGRDNPATAEAGERPDGDVGTLSFEAAMAELEAIVRKLEGGQGALEDSIRDYERGAQLRVHCAGKLREAQLTIERINRAADGSIESRPDPELETGSGE